MTAILLSLVASGSWGVADFLGGMLSRRDGALPVALVTQVVGLLIATAVALSAAGAPIPAAFVPGLGSGLIVAIGLLAFYRALATGTMGVVAPIAATGALVPVIGSLLLGERPSTGQFIGMAVALTGAVAAAAAPSRGPRSAAARSSVLLAATAAVLLGIAQLNLAHAADADAAWAVSGLRLGAVAMIGAIAVAMHIRPPAPGRLARIAGVGVLDTTAILAFAAATTVGLVAVAVVFSSLYPVVTILLARRVLGERLSRVQTAGVVLALAGLAIVSIAGA